MINKDEYIRKVQGPIIFPGFAHEMKIVSCFENRSYIKYTDSFKNNILAKANPVITGMPEIHFRKERMLHNVMDRIIVQWLRLKINQFLTNEQVLSVLVHLMWDQRNGEEGILSITEYDNTFYTKDFVVKAGYGLNGFQCDAIPYSMERGKNDFIFYPTFIADTVKTI
jgi:hypothetical protein